ncbi:hypothetical protein [Micromonospora sp. NPDC004551]|uniref:hypothetical protein n=1 Tax=Micromonospora sp. NPDC004551 TaxID=3154284 RepID=UPI0033B4C69E
MERVLGLRVHGVSNTPPDQLLGLRPAPGGDGALFPAYFGPERLRTLARLLRRTVPSPRQGVG